MTGGESHVKLAAIWTLLVIPACASAQSAEEEDPLVTPTVAEISPGWSPAGDSAARRLAVLAVEKADAEARATSFWRRLMPSATIAGTVGVRDLMFQETGGTVLFPKDSYRISAMLSLSGLLDGSRHEMALIAREEAETRLALLVHRQETARLALRRKALQLRALLTALEEELAVWRSLAAYQEILFTQGKADFRAVARAKVDGIRIRGAVARASAQLCAIEDALQDGERK